MSIIRNKMLKRKLAGAEGWMLDMVRFQFTHIYLKPGACVSFIFFICNMPNMRSGADSERKIREGLPIRPMLKKI
jgi:hypothetical protein